jgi:hypothetical protein
MKVAPHTKCHPERSEGSMRPQERSLATLGMTLFLSSTYSNKD